MVGRDRWGDAPVGMKSIAMCDIAGNHMKRAHILHAITRCPGGIAEMLRPFDVRLIHAHFGVDAVYAERVAALLDIPLVSTFHGFDVTTRMINMIRSGKPSWINYLLHRRALARSGQLFLCVSEYIRQRALSHGYPEKRMRVHYMGIDTKRIFVPESRSDIPIVLHVGRLVEKKGCADLIQAFANLPARHRDARLVIVGDGPLRGVLESSSQALGLSKRVVFMGPQPQHRVHELMREAMLLCQPSVTARSGDAEGFGMVLLEAAASGIPAIGTRSGGIVEAVVDGQTGLLVREHDIAGLTRSMTDLMDSSSTRKEMGRAARRRVEEHFDVAKQSALLAEYYKELV